MGIHEAHLPLYVSLPDIEKCRVWESNPKSASHHRIFSYDYFDWNSALIIVCVTKWFYRWILTRYDQLNFHGLMPI